jgi:ABC-type transport system involved in cytochrome c biogenesis permease subunit
MLSGPLAPLLAGLSLLISALAYARRWGLAAWLGGAGAAILAGALAARGLAAGHWPLTNLYEFALAFALATTLTALGLGRAAENHHRACVPRDHESRGAPAVHATSLLLASALVLYARLVMPDYQRTIQPVLPALDSFWLLLHVASAALAYGALAVAGAAGFVWLVLRPDRAGAAWLLHQGIAWGYPLLTLSLIFGMIWAQVAWGRYWDWDLKEVWSLATWLLYSLYFHLCGRPSWQGRRLAWLAFVGLGAVLFTFLGAGWLARMLNLESLHLF